MLKQCLASVARHHDQSLGLHRRLTIGRSLPAGWGSPGSITTNQHNGGMTARPTFLVNHLSATTTFTTLVTFDLGNSGTATYSTNQEAHRWTTGQIQARFTDHSTPK